jgi:hypothetical protein
MRRGRFERHGNPDDGFVFRVRWDAEPVPPTPEELRRLEFLRYLVQSGRLSEHAER